ncbi:MAG: tetratricopeptide repeat protein [Thiomargarita sp.]|nr:tetratricopeptide repeat protein [Thiomargarita sp.]
MATYETEEEQIEAIKKWWKENGISVVTGLVLGLTLLGGWRWWQTYTDQQGQLASNIYDQVLFSLENKQIKHARDLTGQLLSDYSDSPYAMLAVLNIARQDLDEGDIDSSHAHLQWVTDQNGGLSELTHIARLRKVRLFLSEDKFVEAKTLIDGVKDDKFKGVYAELRGDIAVAQGQLDVAGTAYTEALESQDLSFQHQKWVQIKRDDLGEKVRIEASMPLSVIGHSSTTQETVLKEVPIENSVMGNSSTTQETVLKEVPIENSPASIMGNSSTMQETVLKEVPIENTPASIMGNSSTMQETVLTLPLDSSEEPATNN